MKTVAIIQARMNSKRLPGKVLLQVEGKKMLELMIERVKFSKYANKIIVATSKNDSDNPIALFCKINKIDCYRGSELDVLDRIYNCATVYKANHVVRLTADDPLQEPEVMDQVIGAKMAKLYVWFFRLNPLRKKPEAYNS